MHFRLEKRRGTYLPVFVKAPFPEVKVGVCRRVIESTLFKENKT